MKKWLKNLAINLWNVSPKDNLITQVVDFFIEDEN